MERAGLRADCSEGKNKLPPIGGVVTGAPSLRTSEDARRGLHQAGGAGLSFEEVSQQNVDKAGAAAAPGCFVVPRNLSATALLGAEQGLDVGVSISVFEAEQEPQQAVPSALQQNKNPGGGAGHAAAYLQKLEKGHVHVVKDVKKAERAVKAAERSALGPPALPPASSPFSQHASGGPPMSSSENGSPPGFRRSSVSGSDRSDLPLYVRMEENHRLKLLQEQVEVLQQ